jgi:hypothetical protein
MAEEGLGKPFAEADSQVEALQEFLEENDAAEGVEIESILVFYGPKAKLDAGSAPRPVTDVKGLKKTLRKLATGKLPPAKYKELQKLFDDQWEEF